MSNTLNELRPGMTSVACRMPGYVADAEDAVRDACPRLHEANKVTT